MVRLEENIKISQSILYNYEPDIIQSISDAIWSDSINAIRIYNPVKQEDHDPNEVVKMGS